MYFSRFEVCRVTLFFYVRYRVTRARVLISGSEKGDILLGGELSVPSSQLLLI